MTGALLRLLGWSLRGRIVRSLRMLRQPKYLFGVVVGGAWILWWTLGTLIRSDIRFEAAGFHGRPDLIAVIRVIAPLGIAVMATVSWLIPWGRLRLPFKEAELHQLLPAPVSRRRLIQFGLLKAQVGVCLTSLFLALIAGGGGPSDRLRTFVALWTMFSIWDLHGRWRSLFLLRQRELSSRAAALRRGLLTMGLAAYWAVLGPRVYAGVRRGQELLDRWEPRTILDLFGEPVWQAVVPVLRPFSIVTDLPLAESWSAFAVALPLSLILLVLHHEIVVRSKAHLEEQALEHARRESAKSSPTRGLRRLSSRARRRRPFRLDPVGRPETAILWKNLMQTWRHSLAGTTLAAIALLVVIAVAPNLLGWHPAFHGGVMVVGGMMALIFTLTAGMTWQNDLRSEISRLEYARTWPVDPARLVLAEIASPAVLGFMLAAFGLGVSLSGFVGVRTRAFLGRDASDLPALLSGETLLGTSLAPALLLLTLGVLPLLAAGCLASSALQNLAVLWLPAWVPQGSGRQRGIAALGQRLVFASALGLVMLVVGVPSAALVGLAVWLQWLAGIPWSAWAFPLWGLLASAPALAASLLIVQVGGRLWAALDASSEILESGS